MLRGPGECTEPWRRVSRGLGETGREWTIAREDHSFPQGPEGSPDEMVANGHLDL